VLGVETIRKPRPHFHDGTHRVGCRLSHTAGSVGSVRPPRPLVAVVPADSPGGLCRRDSPPGQPRSGARSTRVCRRLHRRGTRPRRTALVLAGAGAAGGSATASGAWGARRQDRSTHMVTHPRPGVGGSGVRTRGPVVVDSAGRPRETEVIADLVSVFGDHVSRCPIATRRTPGRQRAHSATTRPNAAVTGESLGQHPRAEAGKPDRDEQDTSALTEPDDAIGEQGRRVAVGVRVSTRRTWGSRLVGDPGLRASGVIIEDHSDVVAGAGAFGRDWALPRRWAIALDDGSLVFRNDDELEVD